MEDSFKFEIISPEKIVFADNAKMVTLPSYEGNMGILKNHISIITFLRPGIIKIQKNGESVEEFFVQDGTAEYFNESLVVLSTSAINVNTKNPEFSEWKWIELTNLPNIAVHFKKEIYKKIKEELNSLSLD